MKIKLILVVLILASETYFAQILGPKWISVLDLPDQKVYVDTSSIKQVSGQISALSISLYKKPMLITSLNKEASSVKSQILFNAALKKYSVIGTIYYDRNLKILGETSLPGFVSSSDNFSTPVKGNQVMTAIFNKVTEYLNSSAVLADNENVPVQETKKNESVKLNSNISQDKPKPVKQDTVSSFNRVAMYLSKRDSAQKAIPQNTPQGKNIPALETAKVNNSREQKKNSAGLQSRDNENEVETNPKSTIFTDGSRYSFQVSSWKNKAKAESEAARLKSAGYNAYLTEGLVRGTTWYRVRIGYFNSLEAAEDAQKKLRN